MIKFSKPNSKLRELALDWDPKNDEEPPEELIIEKLSDCYIDVIEQKILEEQITLKLIKDIETPSAKHYLGEIKFNNLNPEYTASDGELLENVLKKEFSPVNHFILIDYLPRTSIHDEYFHIRIWELVK
jgi:hypothetical protein